MQPRNNALGFAYFEEDHTLSVLTHYGTLNLKGLLDIIDVLDEDKFKAYVLVKIPVSKIPAQDS